MTTNDEILILANQIANKGDKPTIALIKAKLKKKVSLPEIISVLKTWQHDPDFIKLPEQEDNTFEKEKVHTTVASEPFEQILHQELAGMKKEILELKSMVQDLINQQKK